MFLDRPLTCRRATGDHPFTDIGNRREYEQQAIANLYEAGIAAGCTATNYCPTASVTRGQMSKFIVIGYGLTPIAGPAHSPMTTATSRSSTTTGWRPTGSRADAAAGLYCPQATVLREQMAKFLFEAEN